MEILKESLYTSRCVGCIEIGVTWRLFFCFFNVRRFDAKKKKEKKRSSACCYISIAVIWKYKMGIGLLADAFGTG